ncbi:GCN5-related N-acetyltransferase 7, chloroplastic isoform X2 [Alnus glutinosa]|uniref:GCN5-related N-acetyltransferase 7, chloroplastic isoform X2 n=1 Tax=Alnus glutinosa TaxID=3517 RepID=UPI002D7896AF|nr:GCN5-related N-acetyltransferase 7, chloroplastic isoform X2 [Alnus glutinosa]
MALLSSTPSLSFASPSRPANSNCGLSFFTFNTTQFSRRQRPIASSHLSSTLDTNPIDKSSLNLAEAFSEEELWAAACLRVRSFYEFRPSAYGIRDHRRYLAEREFEALKERVAGIREGFRRVSCINATLPMSQISNFADDLCSECKFSDNGEERVVVGTLDLNQCISLPEEITGMKPEGIGADFARAYLSNVCVAKELHRNGLGYWLVAKSKIVAQDWAYYLKEQKKSLEHFVKFLLLLYKVSHMSRVILCN